MPTVQAIVRDAVAGLVAGAVILGVGARLLMRGIALLFGGAAGFSWGGTVEVILFGAIVGLFAGVAHALFVRRFVPKPLWRGIVLGLGPFLVLAFSPMDSRLAIAAYPESAWLPILLAFAALFLAFGLAVAFRPAKA